MSAISAVTLNLTNIQGDIIFGLPKQTQKFFFFHINSNEVNGFRTNLGKLVENKLITTAEETKGNIGDIKRAKLRAGLSPDEGDGETVHPAVITVSGVNIAFSAKGLDKMGITEDINEAAFKNGMKSHAQSQLGDGIINADGTFNLGWDAMFAQEEEDKVIHAVALVAGDSLESVDETLANVKSVLNGTVTEVGTVSGDVRPGDNKGHEHFGYKDGISNPVVEGSTDTPVPPEQQATIKQGIALLGRDGDVQRPDWALGGSFMAFRKLPQLVPEFEKFLVDKAGEDGADLLGARFVGRWKSGAPLIDTPDRDDEALADDNDFTFLSDQAQEKCPFHAHIRKMNPRGDFGGASGDDFIKTRMILRRGIPFGPEVSPAEAASGVTNPNVERGLLFVCYQSQLNQGFVFLQQAWANSPNFPSGKTPDIPGFDPIIGQISGGERMVTGAFKSNISEPLKLDKQWVLSSGGEYFFSPSISTLQDVFGKNA